MSDKDGIMDLLHTIHIALLGNRVTVTVEGLIHDGGEAKRHHAVLNIVWICSVYLVLYICILYFVFVVL